MPSAPTSFTPFQQQQQQAAQQTPLQQTPLQQVPQQQVLLNQAQLQAGPAVLPAQQVLAPQAAVAAQTALPVQPAYTTAQPLLPQQPLLATTQTVVPPQAGYTPAHTLVATQPALAGVQQIPLVVSPAYQSLARPGLLTNIALSLTGDYSTVVLRFVLHPMLYVACLDVTAVGLTKLQSCTNTCMDLCFQEPTEWHVSCLADRNQGHFTLQSI